MWHTTLLRRYRIVCEVVGGTGSIRPCTPEHTCVSFDNKPPYGGMQHIYVCSFFLYFYGKILLSLYIGVLDNAQWSKEGSMVWYIKVFFT